MGKEVNKGSVKATRRSTRSKTQAIFFDRSPVLEIEVESTIPSKEDKLSSQERVQKDVQGRMFSFNKLLGIFSHLENEASQRPLRHISSTIPQDLQVKDSVMEKKKLFESLARSSTASEVSGACSLVKELFGSGDE